jgi:hypothetical protein
MILAPPITDERTPEAMTMRHNGNPRLWTLVALLFRLPRTLKPRISIAVPRNTKPWSGESNGQFRAKYDLNRLSSETVRKIPMVLVMKWDTPSKKKNCSTCQQKLLGDRKIDPYI